MTPSAFPTRANAPRWFFAVLWLLAMVLAAGFDGFEGWVVP